MDPVVRGRVEHELDWAGQPSDSFGVGEELVDQVKRERDIDGPRRVPSSGNGAQKIASDQGFHFCRSGAQIEVLAGVVRLMRRPPDPNPGGEPVIQVPSQIDRDEQQRPTPPGVRREVLRRDVRPPENEQHHRGELEHGEKHQRSYAHRDAGKGVDRRVSPPRLVAAGHVQQDHLNPDEHKKERRRDQIGLSI